MCSDETVDPKHNGWGISLWDMVLWIISFIILAIVHKHTIDLNRIDL